MVLYDFHEVFDEADVWFGGVLNEKFLLSIFVLLLFIETNVNAADVVRIFDCLMD